MNHSVPGLEVVLPVEVCTRQRAATHEGHFRVTFLARTLPVVSPGHGRRVLASGSLFRFSLQAGVVTLGVAWLAADGGLFGGRSV